MTPWAASSRNRLRPRHGKTLPPIIIRDIIRIVK